MSYLLWHYLSDSAARHPSRPAVASASGGMTYQELDEASTRVARLFEDARIGRGSRVGLCLPKSARAVAAMIGASKAGAAYVPVDPSAPARRGGFILADCAVRALVTTRRKLKDYENVLTDLPALELVLLVDDESGDQPGSQRTVSWPGLPDAGPLSAAPASIESDPAYLLYTSGSTGQPKGVILSHRHARTFVDWSRDTFDLESEDRLSNHAPFHFDLSVFDLYGAVSAGACVSIVPDGLAPFPMELARWIERERISVWYSVPSALVRLLLHGSMERFDYEHLRAVLFAGEVFPVKYLRQVMDRLPCATFHNLYGPTETNVCTYYTVPRPLPASATEIPIGRACANTAVFTVDEDGAEVPIGGTGELLVRGPVVMLGYWGLADRTRRSLVPNPLQSAYHEPAYRTGDLVRRAEDDLYYFVGRRDHMVKARGYRIELGEIEQALYQHHGVREAVVVALPHEQFGNTLHAAVAPAEGVQLSPQELGAFCADLVPRYMVPESFLLRSELPKTSTGKIDRVALRREIQGPHLETSPQ